MPSSTAPHFPSPEHAPVGRTWIHSGAPLEAEWRTRAGPMMVESLLVTGIIADRTGPQSPDESPPPYKKHKHPPLGGVVVPDRS